MLLAHASSSLACVNMVQLLGVSFLRCVFGMLVFVDGALAVLVQFVATPAISSVVKSSLQVHLVDLAVRAQFFFLARSASAVFSRAQEDRCRRTRESVPRGCWALRVLWCGLAVQGVVELKCMALICGRILSRHLTCTVVSLERSFCCLGKGWRASQYSAGQLCGMGLFLICRLRVSVDRCFGDCGLERSSFPVTTAFLAMLALCSRSWNSLYRWHFFDLITCSGHTANVLYNETLVSVVFVLCATSLTICWRGSVLITRFVVYHDAAPHHEDALACA